MKANAMAGKEVNVFFDLSAGPAIRGRKGFLQGFWHDVFFVFDRQDGARYVWEENGVEDDHEAAIDMMEMECR